MNGLDWFPSSRPALLLTAVLMLAAPAGHAQPAAADAFEQNRKLGRGVNILGYDPIWRSREQARFQAGYFRLLKEAGFSSVRINLQPFRRMNSANGYALSESWFEVLDWAVRQAQAQDLRVILDLHEYNSLGNDPATNKVKFLAFWRQLSAHCQGSPESVLFEVLNEPSRKLTPALWNEYLAEALVIIREKNPTRTLVVGPAFWNSIDHLAEMELPAADRHLIVTIHYYTPMDFTHQGAAWAGRKDKLGIEWLGTETDLRVIKDDFDKAADWAKQHDRPLFLGEFGAYDKAPMESRVRYLASVARAAEQRGWSWAYWQFDSDFILYDIGRDSWIEPIRRALIPATSPKTSRPSSSSTTTKPGELE
ncbi:MAG: glycoside hydrolase family 5 protein [Verrucomicrobiota bacterium]|jgi:endoglucanase